MDVVVAAGYFSMLRRKGAFVKTTYGKSSGPLSFIQAFDSATDAVNQGGFSLNELGGQQAAPQQQAPGEKGRSRQARRRDRPRRQQRAQHRPAPPL